MSVSLAILLMTAIAAPVWVRAQAPTEHGVKPELRFDVIGSRNRTSVQVGGGAAIPAGYYTRIGVICAGGADRIPGAYDRSARLDVVGRFLFDPFRQNRYGLSAGAGVSLRVHDHDRVRPLLVAVLDVEGHRSQGGIVPAIQVGLGGGIRLGAGLRWGGAQSR